MKDMYRSAKFDNFNINLGFRANDKINELHDGDFDNSTVETKKLTNGYTGFRKN